MARFKQIWIDIYRCAVAIFVGTQGEFKDWVNDNCKNDKAFADLVYTVNETEELPCAGRYYWIEDARCSVIMVTRLSSSYKGIGFIAHELGHASFAILRDVGIVLNKDSEEAYTYLHEYLLTEALNPDGWEEYGSKPSKQKKSKKSKKKS